MAREQLAVLDKLDKAKTQGYHFVTIVIAGMGFFTDAYDLFVISIVAKLIGRLYYTDPTYKNPGTLPPNVSAAVTGVALCGTLAGQLFFGWLGDKLGRKSVYGFTLILMVICSVFSGLSLGHEPKGVITTLCFFRFWLGFGVGGDYPLSATIMSEYANKKTRGSFIAAVFAMQNLFQKDIFSKIGWIPKAGTMNAIEEVFRIARAQTYIALCGTVPGYWFTVAFIDIIGRFWIQLMGFVMMTVFMLALAIPYNHWITPGNHIGFVVMYGLTFFFANFGPNATTFIVPAEIFPARLRSTCHGISAAAGKAGAIIGAFGFLYSSQGKTAETRDRGYPKGIGMRNSLFVLAATNLVGTVMSLFVPEAKGKSLEEMSKENLEEGEEKEHV
ncbi:inorganic phosphate transporter 1-4-like protein [Carex littledalei]|uniref:H(+)/Pi cotransporter n=1 Tax=Carex littledalei TaxID=544730 RepID=A0A833RF37_9POAL|nr:inorganic phosphate transporter 1-4-like protein [Carex littledalei]